MTRGKRAEAFFREGYNCAQSVALAFGDLTGMPEDKLASLASPFGGGMGRLREVCGAVSGAFMVLGFVTGYSDPDDRDGKARLYAKEQEFAARFKERNGSIVCRELLAGVKTSAGGAPEGRSAEFYKKRPCPLLVRDAADILEEMLTEKGDLK